MVSEWTQILGLVLMTKILIERRSKESNRLTRDLEFWTRHSHAKRSRYRNVGRKEPRETLDGWPATLFRETGLALWRRTRAHGGCLLSVGAVKPRGLPSC